MTQTGRPTDADERGAGTRADAARPGHPSGLGETHEGTINVLWLGGRRHHPCRGAAPSLLHRRWPPRSWAQRLRATCFYRTLDRTSWRSCACGQNGGRSKGAPRRGSPRWRGNPSRQLASQGPSCERQRSRPGVRAGDWRDGGRPQSLGGRARSRRTRETIAWLDQSVRRPSISWVQTSTVCAIDI